MEIYVQTPFDRHYGEEFIYCLEGTLEMMIDNETCVLEAGDSVVFDGTTPHRYAPGNLSSGNAAPTRILAQVPQFAWGIGISTYFLNLVMAASRQALNLRWCWMPL
jgi:hypothetical protein